MIKTGSDFSGVGAFDQALRKLGIDYQTVYACDWDKYARQTYIENYGKPKYFPKDVYEREIPKESLDIYMTSPPCQAFSLAGNRKGEDDKRGILFYNSHEFIQKNKPRYFIFENVKGLLSDAGGLTFKVWLDMLGGKSVNGNPVLFPNEKSTPYHIYWQVLNAKHYGVPQNRERVFIIGIRYDADNTFRFPKTQHLKKKLKDVLENNINDKYFLSEKMINGFSNHKERHEKKGTGFKWQPKTKEDIANCLRANAALCPTDNTIIVTNNKKVNQEDFLNKNQLQKFNELKVDENISGCITNAIGRAGSSNEYMSSIKRNAIITKKIRRLTPRECFRLMDFPDTFKWSVSDTQAYKQAGNSIVVNVLAEIIKKLKL